VHGLEDIEKDAFASLYYGTTRDACWSAASPTPAHDDARAGVVGSVAIDARTRGPT
jgi:hypothetical protein